jgi:hypothetical protein
MAKGGPRGAFRRKPLAKLQADGQEHHIRRRSEVSWHKTAKPRDVRITVNDAVVYGCMDAGGRTKQEARVEGKPKIGLRNPTQPNPTQQQSTLTKTIIKIIPDYP